MRNLGSSIRRVVKNVRVNVVPPQTTLNMKEMADYLAKKEREYKVAAEADAWKKYQSEWRKYEEKLAEEQRQKEKKYKRAAEEASWKKYETKHMEYQQMNADDNKDSTNNYSSSTSSVGNTITSVGNFTGEFLKGILQAVGGAILLVVGFGIALFILGMIANILVVIFAIIGSIFR